ncbi:MAG: hypothetical protein Q9M91_03260 [Candidatus Dojkabacteria bacterium]|nr:hypothetical protein [Candidatus Dojkabacteria bacterium]
MNDKIDDRWDNYVDLRDPNIASHEIDSAVEDLVDWYLNSMIVITPVVRIGVLIFRLMEISPYIAGNKLTIAALLDYLLLKQGMSSKIYTSTLKFLENSEKKLMASFDLSRRSHDLSLWLENFTDGLVRELVTVREDIDRFIIEDEKSKKQPFLDLNKRQLKVLKYLQTVPTIKREDYCHMMDVSTMTAFRDMKDLVRKKLIKTEGKGRGTKYKLASM